VLASIGLVLVAVEAPRGGTPAHPRGATAGEVRPPLAGEAVLTSCGPDALGDLAATLTVTNPGAAPAEYDVTVVFETPDGRFRLDTVPVVVTVGPGRRAVRPVPSMADASAAPYACRVGQVARRATRER
jgi:hypothetical protein